MASAVILLPAQFTVKIGTVEATCQVSEATIKFDATTKTVTTLCEETDLAMSEKATLTLAGYQDYVEADGLCGFLWDNALKVASFEITGTDQAGASVTFAGDIQCRRPNYGPTADDAAKFSLDIPVIGIPTKTLVPAP